MNLGGHSSVHSKEEGTHKDQTVALIGGPCNKKQVAYADMGGLRAHCVALAVSAGHKDGELYLI